MSERFDTFRPPALGPDPWETTTPEPETGEHEGLDPREAAALLAHTTRQAERQLEPRGPFFLLTAAVAVVVVYGAAWISVRGQHPYKGPSVTALEVLYGTLAVWIVFAVTTLRRSLSGRSSRQRRVEGTAFATVWICVYIFQGALRHAGASTAIAYGIYPAVAPILLVGSAAVTFNVAREKWAEAGFVLAAVVLAATAPFAGPAGVWGVMGIGLGALLVAAAVAQLLQRRP